MNKLIFMFIDTKFKIHILYIYRFVFIYVNMNKLIFMFVDIKFKIHIFYKPKY